MIRSEKAGSATLVYDPAAAGHGERTVLGGLKTKNVDVVVDKPGIGPVLCVSLKGTLRAFRNLTNRMEEAAGDCANLHITYPALVYGFLSLIRGNVAAEGVPANDVAMVDEFVPHENIRRYHDVLERLARRTGIREEASRYEAMGLGLVLPSAGLLSEHFPHLDDGLRFERFFVTLYQRYDERYVFAAPALASTTRRLEWRDTAELQERQLSYDYRFRFS